MGQAKANARLKAQRRRTHLSQMGEWILQTGGLGLLLSPWFGLKPEY